ncbi:tripartite tricarboxylate transporter TctB family protein [Sulfitobacter sabulilitoris]|uniref:Tripartite tricarboxylate transporter TctB family protein n=1 Tax=Sulfitobacter sabulilitoris TaxID=2562655 RepID=A0A5S3PD22_9RHOB|nr:tripartite tricarboxylate transporter TctB family protein [Sulfitobacter sabulilitoris]TMM51764.1 tripartite tricarboxylate transporter TctB family protein [Sulfitobacter sabulilitoris]
MSDRIFGLVGLCVAAIFAWRATLIQESFLSDAVGPKAFPLIIAVVLALSSLYFVVRPDPDPRWPPVGRLAEIGMAVAVLCVYAVALPELGFVIATALAATYLTWRLGTAPLWSVVVGVLTSGGIYTVFHLILGLSLARGPLGF